MDVASEIELKKKTQHTMPQTQGTVLENGLVTGQQDPDDCSGMKYGGK